MGSRSPNLDASPLPLLPNKKIKVLRENIMVDNTLNNGLRFLERGGIRLAGTLILYILVTLTRFQTTWTQVQGKYVIDAIRSHTISPEMCQGWTSDLYATKKSKDFHRWLLQLEYNTPKITQSCGGVGR